MISLADEKRKELTLFLGECWHEVDYEGDSFCCHCGEHYHHVQNRTFTTPDDMVDLAKRMVEQGVWNRFFDYADKRYYKIEFNRPVVHPASSAFAAWLLTDPARFCWLVSEFLTKTEYSDAQRRADFGPNGDATTPGFFIQTKTEV